MFRPDLQQGNDSLTPRPPDNAGGSGVYDRPGNVTKVRQSSGTPTLEQLEQMESSPSSAGDPEELGDESTPEDKNSNEPNDTAHEQKTSRGSTKKGKKRPFRQRAASFLKSNRKKMLIVGAVTSLVIGPFALLVQVGTFLLPTIGKNIDKDRMSSPFHVLTTNSFNIIGLKIQADSTNDARYLQALEEFKQGNPGSGLFAKINRIRPQKISEGMLLESKFGYSEFRIPRTNITRQKITSATIGDRAIVIPQTSTGVVGRVTHPIKYASGLIGFRRDTKAAAISFLEQQAGGRLSIWQRVVVAGKAAKKFRQHINVKPYRWTKAETDKANTNPPSAQDAHSEEVKRSYDANRNNQPNSDNDAAKQGQRSTDACIADKACRDKMVDGKTTVAPEVNENLRQTFSPGVIRSVISHLSSVSVLTAVVCIVAETSVSASEEVIDANSKMAVSTYTQITAAADQQVYTQLHTDDRRTAASLTGGYNEQLNGDGTAIDSVPMQRAAGGTPSTAETLSPQSSGVGMFGTDPTGFMGVGVASFLANSKVCTVATNPWTMVGITLAELGISIVPGAGQAIKAGGVITAKTVSNAVARQFAFVLRHQFTAKQLLRLGAVIGVIEAAELTAAAKQADALQRMGAIYNGAGQGKEYINQGDAGATVLAQEINRQNGGRPLTTPEYRNVKAQDTEFVDSVTKGQPLKERYFALDNSNSLLFRVATATRSGLRLENLDSLITNVANLVSPSALFGKIADLAGNKTHAANDDIPIQTREYGVVQWGWTNDEEAAFAGNDEYAPLYNEKILDQSGQKEDLMEKYGKCFDPTIGSMGMLLSDGEIYRDENANVLPGKGGDCDPVRLGDSGPDKDGVLKFRDEEAEMVFRLRVSLRNNLAVDQLLEIQEAIGD